MGIRPIRCFRSTFFSMLVMSGLQSWQCAPSAGWFNFLFKLSNWHWTFNFTTANNKTRTSLMGWTYRKESGCKKPNHFTSVSCEKQVSCLRLSVECDGEPGLKLYFSCVRFTEKGNLEVLLFTIQSKMRANNQKVFTPREGKLISDINKVKTPTSKWPDWLLPKYTHINIINNPTSDNKVCLCFYTFLIGMGASGEGGAWAWTCPEDRVDSSGEAGAARSTLRQKGCHERNVAEWEPEACLPGNANTQRQVGHMCSAVEYFSDILLLPFSYWPYSFKHLHKKF